MKKSSLALLLPPLVCLLAQPVMAQEAASDVEIFHQGLTAGCIYGFKKDPRAAVIGADVRDKICGCVDGWFRTNNLNDEAAVKANEPLMKQVVTACFAAAVGE